MKKKLVTLATILTMGATPAVALDQEEIDAIFSAPNAPKQGEVTGIAQQGGIIDVVTKDNELKRFNDEWTTLKDVNGNDYHTLGATGVTRSKKTPFANPDDVFTASDGYLDQARANENGELFLVESYMIDGPEQIDGISAANKRKEGYDFRVASNGNVYDAKIVDNMLIVDELPVGSIDAAVVGFEDMNGGKRATVTNNDYTLTKTDANGRVVFERGTDLQPGDNLLIPGSVCYSDSECLSNSCTDKNLYDGIDKKTCD